MARLRELVFLRGLAIILVMLRHQRVFDFTTTMGWIGVDCFFVLSGFLVSGLLFKEYQRYGTISPTRFLIRRGFKIYPIYYLSYVPYLIIILRRDNFEFHRFLANRSLMFGFLGDLTFTQNYVTGWGFAYGASWSLAVEEHFYFLLVVIFWLAIKYQHIWKNHDLIGSRGIDNFQKFVFGCLVLCLALRIISNVISTDAIAKRTITMSHLRLDSLLFGVFISYLFHFRTEQFKVVFNRYRIWLIPLALILLAWTPFVELTRSFFVRTIGFTFTYLAFGLVLIYFILNQSINQELDRILGKRLVDLVSKIGFCSYSIYVIHGLVNLEFKRGLIKFHLTSVGWINFFVTTTLSVVIGMIMTYTIEAYFLKLRNKLYPSRVR